MKFIALDFETGGLQVGVHAPVQLGLALMDGETVIEGREWIIAPHRYKGEIMRKYEPEALAISGLTMEQIEAGYSCRKVMEWAHELVLKHEAMWLPVVGWNNIKFDFPFFCDLGFLGGKWNDQAKKWVPYRPFLPGPWIDGRLQAEWLHPGLPDHKLDTVSAKFGLSRSTDKHGALEDAILAARTWLRMGGKA